MEGGMKEERERKKKKKNMVQCKVQGWLCVVLLVASMSGGFVLAWWVVQFSASKKQQWMVPLSLVLMITPIFVFISLCISGFCTSMDDNSSSVSSLDHHHHQSAEIT